MIILVVHSYYFAKRIFILIFMKNISPLLALELINYFLHFSLMFCRLYIFEYYVRDFFTLLLKLKSNRVKNVKDGNRSLIFGITLQFPHWHLLQTYVGNAASTAED